MYVIHELYSVSYLTESWPSSSLRQMLGDDLSLVIWSSS